MQSILFAKLSFSLCQRPSCVCCFGYVKNVFTFHETFIKSPRKPEMERKRRRRINDCLAQIKQLIPEAKELEVSFGFAKRCFHVAHWILHKHEAWSFFLFLCLFYVITQNRDFSTFLCFSPWHFRLKKAAGLKKLKFLRSPLNSFGKWTISSQPTRWCKKTCQRVQRVNFNFTLNLHFLYN